LLRTVAAARAHKSVELIAALVAPERVSAPINPFCTCWPGGLSDEQALAKARDLVLHGIPIEMADIGRRLDPSKRFLRSSPQKSL